MSEQDNALMFVEMIADSELGSVSEPVLRGALVRCINLLKAARSESEDTQRSEASQPKTADELIAIIRGWLDQSNATEWGGFEKALDAAIETESPPVLPGELVEVARELEPYLDRLLCYASTTSEHEPNRVVKRLRAALTSLPDPLQTVESVRADERERLAKLALDDASNLCRERYLQDDRAKALRYLSDWLRSQKGEG